MVCTLSNKGDKVSEGLKNACRLRPEVIFPEQALRNVAGIHEVRKFKAKRFGNSYKDDYESLVSVLASPTHGDSVRASGSRATS